jgi:hypothetical protein
VEDGFVGCDSERRQTKDYPSLVWITLAQWFQRFSNIFFAKSTQFAYFRKNQQNAIVQIKHRNISYFISFA